ncbi:hypothetical protein C8R45DRAFT_961478 [Mycena sanguinolenta]|nr:hypothetical protein C8R45DRAFT_961478 [Mycena sanguinolenta]
MPPLDNSPFVDRLNTNYVPSDSETMEIRSFLVEPENELTRIDARIEEMEIALALLKEQRALLKKPIDAHGVLISVIRRLPQDILVEIFLACLPSEHDALIDPTEAPLVLGRICRHWRSLVYSTPMLWRSIHIPSPDYLQTPPNILSRLEKIVNEWLERSAACSLSVSINDWNRVFPQKLDKNPLVLQLLPFCRRLQHVTYTGDAVSLRPLLQLGSEDLPLLQTLRMDFAWGGPDSMDAFQIPTLQDVELCMAASVDPHSLPLQWSQLTRLRLECKSTGNGSEGGLHIDGAFDVLGRCPNLVECVLGVTRARVADLARNLSPIILPHLETLVFLVDQPFDNWNGLLVAPKLRYLQLGLEDMFMTRDTLRSLPRDQHIRANINPEYLNLSAFQELLQLFPMISHLRLFTKSLTRVDDAMLAIFGTPHALCPMLTDMIVRNPSPQLSDAAILAFVRARMSMAIPLHQLRVEFSRPMGLDLMEELESFISDGLEVVFKYPPPSRKWRFNPRGGIWGPLAMSINQFVF